MIGKCFRILFLQITIESSHINHADDAYKLYA